MISRFFLRLLEGLSAAPSDGSALLDCTLEEYEAAWQAAGGEDTSTQALGDLLRKLGQPLRAYR